MRLFIFPFALTLAIGSAASAQGQTAMQIAREAGVCGNAGIASAERLADGRISVQCATDNVTREPEIATQTTGGEVAAPTFSPLVTTGALIGGAAAVIAVLDDDSSTSSTSGTQ